MKRPGEVGQDFDAYAKAWADQNYEMEAGYSASGLVRDSSSTGVRNPGDEWGDLDALREQYRKLVDRLRLPASLSVLEIGAGGGRSTVALLDVLGDRVTRYHVIDVAEAFVETLRGRVSRELDIHIVSDVDVSMIESSSVDLVLSQSAWSHINLYDQYRYLRDLRRVLKKGAPIVVNGQFLLGAADDWTWNRFRRRVGQSERQVEGVYHEFTSIAAMVEMLSRLGYRDITMFSHGFIARRGDLVGTKHHPSLPQGLTYRYRSSLDLWSADGRAIDAALPPRGPDRPSTLQSRLPSRLRGVASAARANAGRARRSVKRRVAARRQH